MMGLVLLLIAVAFEVAFSVYCFATKQNHTKAKNWGRIGIFAVFIVLALSSVIVWSLRWAVLGLLLFLLALKAAVSLIRNKTKKSYKPSAIAWKSIVMIAALIFACIPAIVFPQHTALAVTGKYKVANATYTYTDKNRVEEFTDKGGNRFVNVEFWYPEHADGTYPLLVFSHGAYGIKASNTSTYNELASHGYIVVSIDHPYHSFFTRSADGTVATINTAYNQEITNMNNGVYSKEELFQLTQKWMKLRTDDMNFVIDTILAKAGKDRDPVYQHIDTKKIGVFGHSMGAAASVWLGRERKDISAVVNIDAPFFSELTYSKETSDFAVSTKPYTIPLLNIYSDDVWNQLESNSLYAANKLDNPQFKEAYTTHFKGAKHLSLTDLPFFSPVLADTLQGGKADINQEYCIKTENELILKFFDEKLKGIGHFTAEKTY
ncbi:alpha/beta hydrolase family protein [Ectobacillus ponti]|uniref:Alpha/beta hydrolase n=1 Tax=Ectobacillus ponti TaxID=2961894 RepID=A0AA41X372_9BACI|nr:alpha/beta hydrolase [Ectobacillus ponti]MCP8968114.1 alpha/beta hydrolase [Ectobacillus ponti]